MFLLQELIHLLNSCSLPRSQLQSNASCPAPNTADAAAHRECKGGVLLQISARQEPSHGARGIITQRASQCHSRPEYIASNGLKIIWTM